jgi:Putative addiction module component
LNIAATLNARRKAVNIAPQRLRAYRANFVRIGDQLGKRLHRAPPRGIISPVNASLPLDQMSTEEKLAALEAIWGDLSRNEQQLPVPDWHKQVLDQRQRQIDRGEATFIDWEEAKRRIRERTG